MKCRVVFKNPDALEDAIYRMVEDNFPVEEGYSNEESRDSKDLLVKHYMTKAEKWFRNGELVTLEIDFNNMTCVVIKQSN